MVYAPEGFAHGYQTMTDGTEMNYMTTAVYVPAAAKGILYNDPVLAIEWPLPVSVISDQDQNWPNYRVYCTSGPAK
jgi:dTDP-4-dehydrorhamnose 3,5-epimerase